MYRRQGMTASLQVSLGSRMLFEVLAELGDACMAVRRLLEADETRSAEALGCELSYCTPPSAQAAQAHHVVPLPQYSPAHSQLLSEVSVAAAVSTAAASH